MVLVSDLIICISTLANFRKKMHSDETLAHTEVERREAVRSGMKSRSSEKRSGDISGGEKDTESATTKPGKKRLKLESEPLTKID